MASHLNFCRWPRNWHPASTKLSESVQKSKQFSSSIQYASVISLRDGGTTSRLPCNLNGLFLAFALPLFLREMVQIDCKTIQMPKKKIHYHVILTSYSRLQPIGHDRQQLVSEILASFQVSYCITAPKGYALFGIQ